MRDVSAVEHSMSHTCKKIIQNRLKSRIIVTMLDAMTSEIEDPKYYAPKMKCIPDLSRQEQMSAVRC